MKVSFITTIYNEEKAIRPFLESLYRQTRLPDEIIIVDGGSEDKTLHEVKEFLSSVRNKKIPTYILEQKGNRSTGRNHAIKKAHYETIACSDAGCTLDIFWLETILKSFVNSVDVVAGYYKGVAENIFQECLIPYVLVMPDRVNSHTFLPASRSMAFTKKIWKKAKGFPEQFSHNEDYIFACTLKKLHAKIAFTIGAIAYWIPRKNIRESFIMFFRFAYGDAEAGMLRPKVGVLFARYFLFFVLVTYFIVSNSIVIFAFLITILIAYTTWSIAKNFKYIKKRMAILYLPLIQLTSDIAVLSGTLMGAFQLINRKIS